jgi:hypothetical protein
MLIVDSGSPMQRQHGINGCGDQRLDQQTTDEHPRPICGACRHHGLALSPTAQAQPEDCDETLNVSDPYDLAEETDVSVDSSTLVYVEELVDDDTERIDEALDPESDDQDPPDGINSDDLIDESRSEIEDAVDLGRQ